MFKEIFNKPYSKEEYDKLDNKAKSQKETAEMTSYGEYNFAKSLLVGAALEEYGETQAKLKKMKEHAHGEALQINEQYDQLLEKAKEATEDLYNFQRDKLGMHDEKSLEKK